MDQQQSHFNAQEKQAAISLAVIYAVRMMGLFMVLPVLALYVDGLAGATPTLLGFALGVYGLTQALLQIPFGLLSDRYGRKRLIIIGLLLFALGSLIAAVAETIYGLILGRAIQGAGAIASVVMALAADLSRENQRTKVMAIIGVSIGASFMVSIVLGPLLNNYIGVPGIFVLTVVFAVLGILIIKYWVPEPRQLLAMDLDSSLIALYLTLRDTQLMALNIGIFILHMVITACFIAVPLLLRDTYGVSESQHWLVYFWVLLGSILLAIPCIMASDRRQLGPSIMVGAVFVLALTLFILGFFSHTLWSFLGVLLAFFAAFNLLEASLPAQVSKVVTPARKGVALGVYSSCQFMGAFVGGVIGGSVLGVWGASSILLYGSIMAGIWLLIVALTGQARLLRGLFKRGTN